MEWLLAHNCRANQQTSSFGSLEGTNIHFSQSILPVNAFGHLMSGQYTLSPDQKRITATVGGECASIYFGRKEIYGNGLLPIVTHEVPVWFDNIGKTSSFFWYQKYTQRTQFVLVFSEQKWNQQYNLGLGYECKLLCDRIVCYRELTSALPSSLRQQCDDDKNKSGKQNYVLYPKQEFKILKSTLRLYII